MSETVKHHRVTIAFHWMTFALLLISFGSAFAREFVDDDDLLHSLLNIHRSFGILVIVFVICRLLARLRFFSKSVSIHLSDLVRKSAAAVHTLIYVLLLAVPLLGWLFTSAAGKSFRVFDLFLLPALIAKNRSLAENLGDIHRFSAYFLLALIAFHTAVALWHHFVKQDHVLGSMLPKSNRKTSS